MLSEEQMKQVLSLVEGTWGFILLCSLLLCIFKNLYHKKIKTEGHSRVRHAELRKKPENQQSLCAKLSSIMSHLIGPPYFSVLDTSQ